MTATLASHPLPLPSSSSSSSSSSSAMAMASVSASASATASAPSHKVDSFEVGWLFVQEYYTFLNRDPNKLHCFYNKKSTFLHGHEGDSAKTCVGQTVCIIFSSIM